MAGERARPCAPPFIDPPGDARHQPEETLPYRLVEQQYPAFVVAREAQRTMEWTVHREDAAIDK